MTHHLIAFAILGCLSSFSFASTSTDLREIKGSLYNITLSRFQNVHTEYELANTEIVLSPGNKKVYPTKNGEFFFTDVPAGEYRIDVFSLNNFYEPVYVTVPSRGTIEGYHANQQYRKREYLQYPFVISSKGHLPYFEIEEEFNIFNMAKSGYGIMIGLMILMMFCAKNMPSMDEMEDMNRAPEQGVEDQPRTQNQPLTRGGRRQ